MMKLKALCAALLLAAPAAAARLPRPEPAALLDAALAEPATGYLLRSRVQLFAADGASRAQTRETRWAGPGRERVASYAKRKTPSLVRVWDGGEETLFVPAMKRAWRGPRGAQDGDAIRRHRERLRALYDLSVSTGGQVAKRPTWRLDLRSKADGRLRRSLWVDRATSFTLKREDYRPDGTLRLRERALRWEPGPVELAGVDVPAAAKVTSRREPFLGCTAARPCAAPGLEASFPAWLPEGYMLFDVFGSTRPSLVTAFMDGRASASIIAVPPGKGAFTGPDEKPYASVALKDGKAQLYWGKNGACLSLRGRSRDVAFCGDLAEDELARVVDSLEPAR